VTRFILAALFAGFCISTASAADGNRLAYLDDPSPFYPHLKFPKLITPQWVGEEGVDAVVILAIDDMRGHEKWETYLRPILERLKKIDGRAPVSIMTCQIDPKHEHLQKWLKEGVSLETHTADHPCPLFRKGDFAFAKATYDKCVDQLFEVPNPNPAANAARLAGPVAFRTPCCDSLNTVSPRFYAEIFNKTTAKGNFLQIDSSVFTWFTPNDPDLPRDLVYDKNGRMRFAKYLPQDRAFVNVIEDCPYPYVINRLCWEFPCMTPSDWQAQHLHGSNNPKTVEDWKAALDCTVIKQGVFSVVFHPHGWIKNEQVIDFIDYAQTKYGKRVKFLNFREALERLNKNVLGGETLRNVKTGEDNGVQLRDLNEHGFIDASIRKSNCLRLWDTAKKVWRIDNGRSFEFTPLTFIDVADGARIWIKRKNGEQFFDVSRENAPKELTFRLPPGARLPSKPGEDTGLRFVDLDGDGKLDVIFSDENEYGIYLFESMEKGWSRKVIAGKRGEGDKNEIPPIAIKGTNNGAWIANRHIWWVNENTDLLKDFVDRRAFSELVPEAAETPKPPEEALKLLQARKGFTVEQVVAEPLVQDPIAFAWGPDGKLWVVEMGDYPLGTDGKGKFGGKIKFLESTNNDGKYDKATVFLDGLGFPTGVLPWKKGVLVTCAPDIFYAEEIDGKVVKTVLFTGFNPGNQQHRVNTLAWGLDNWIHCANGDSGGIVKSIATGKTVDIRGRDFRIKPDTGEIETEAGQTQYGRCRDDWGNWFGCNNSYPMWHVAIEDRYLKRNPHVAGPPPTRPVYEVSGAAPVFPISRTLPRFNDPGAANRFTSACSTMVYRDDLFGPHFAGSAFVSEPVHNLVHREAMTATGTTFRSRRGFDEERSEFLASADNWFRPTTIATGPDGALWVADMYRHVIEHPEWIPLDWQKKLDLRAGHDKGRIYKVVPVGVKPRAIPRLDKLKLEELVASLESPNGWQRDTVQQMLIWKNDKEAATLLEKLARESKNPLARLHALCTLDGLNDLRPEVVAAALADQHPGVLRHAVRLCEGRFTTELGKKVVGLAQHADPQLRLQIAYTLGEWKDAAAGKPLGDIARAAGDDRYILSAAFSSLNATNFAGFAEAVLAPSDKPLPVGLLNGLLTFAVAQNDMSALAKVLIVLAESKDGRFTPAQFESLGTLVDALDRKGLTLARLERSVGEMKEAIAKVRPAFEQARKIVQDESAKPADQVAALRLLGRDRDSAAEDAKLIAKLLSPQVAGEVQSAAVTALSRTNVAEAPALLLKPWKGYSPAVRSQVLAVLLSRREWTGELLDALEKQTILAAETDAASRQRLTTYPDRGVQWRAQKLLAGSIDADRQKVIDSYKPALMKDGDRERGKQVFAKTCAACHKLGDVGEGLGPDLTALTDKSPEYLLTNILDPNRAVEARYIGYTATLKDGTSRAGFLTAETATSITLVGPDGKVQTILRTDLESLRSSGKSAMPEGIEKDVSIDQMADVLAFLRANLPPDKRKEFPGNVPEIVKPDADGMIRLRATACEIYGKTLAFEANYKNLGFWGSADDHAVWTAAIPKAGRYDVWLDWACDPANAGNSFLIEAGSAKLTGKIESTGSWDTYRQEKVGTIQLEAGQQKIVIRATGPLKGYLMDLRGLRLALGKE
jgi:putative membrane-bound dehydrogenase-like protein